MERAHNGMKRAHNQIKRAQTEWKEHINKSKEHIKTIVERICFAHKSVTAFHIICPLSYDFCRSTADCVFKTVKLLFQQETNVVYFFLEGNELNVLYCFSICYFNVTKLYVFGKATNITVFGKFSRYWEQKLAIFVHVLLEKTAHAQLRYHTRKSRKTW